MIVRPRTRIDSCQASKGFGLFKPETEQMVRRAEVETNEAIEGMKRAWAAYGDENIAISGFQRRAYDKMLASIKNLRYTAMDVETFSIALAEFQDEDFALKPGIFLSALINNCQEEKFVIYTRHLSKEINRIGYLTTKDITVEGDAGNAVGMEMVGGTIIVNGKAGYHIGRNMKDGTITVYGDVEADLGSDMEGGTIIVKGNSGLDTGVGMKGGSITVEGDAERDVGSGMKGGKIFLGGRYHLASGIYGGSIYHKGKLIVDTGLKL